MPEPDLATPIDAPLQWPEPPETVKATHRRIGRSHFGSTNCMPYLFRWMEDDPHEPIQPEECPQWS